MTKQLNAVLLRLQSDDKQTLGTLYACNGLELLHECKMLELPNLNNKVEASRIPAGRYWVSKRNSKKFGWHFEINNVPNRTAILMHVGNYHTQILGCLLPGVAHIDINKDGIKDVTSSRDTLDQLMKVLPSGFFLTIVDLDY